MNNLAMGTPTSAMVPPLLNWALWPHSPIDQSGIASSDTGQPSTFVIAGDDSGYMSEHLRHGPVSAADLSRIAKSRGDAMSNKLKRVNDRSHRDTGKTAIVTGGASGIGRATAVKFAEEGWNVALIDLDHAGLKRVLKLIQGMSPAANHFMGQADLSDLRQTRRIFADMGRQYHGKVDAVFANAGRHVHGTILDTSETTWDRVLDANLRSAFLTIKYALPLLIANNGGSIILCGSDQSLVAKRANFAYGITKAAIAQMTRSLAVDYAPKNIRVNCVCPGTIDTPLVSRAISRIASRHGIEADKVRQRLETAQPIQRLGRPEEVASIVYFLAGNEASYVTGAFWAVDGGYTAQ